MKGMGVIFLQDWGEIWTFRSVMGGQPQPRKQYEQCLVVEVSGVNSRANAPALVKSRKYRRKVVGYSGDDYAGP